MQARRVSPLEILREIEFMVRHSWKKHGFHDLDEEEAVELLPDDLVRVRKDFWGNTRKQPVRRDELELVSIAEPWVTRALIKKQAMGVCLVGAGRVARVLLNGIKPNLEVIEKDLGFKLSLQALAWSIQQDKTWSDFKDQDIYYTYNSREQNEHRLRNLIERPYELVIQYNDWKGSSQKDVLRIVRRAVKALEQRRYKELFGRSTLWPKTEVKV